MVLSGKKLAEYRTWHKLNMETLQRTANRGSISTGAYEIDNSCKFESDNREYLRWTNFSTYASSARKKKFSMSLWCKRTELGSQQIIWSTQSNGYLSFEADDEIKWYQTYSGVQKQLNTNRVFRDTSAWYNIIVAVDSTQATEANRMRLYVNGVEETSFVTATYPSQNDEAQNIYEQHLYLGEWGGGSDGFNGYIADYLFVSEVQLVPSDVGEYDGDSGIWKPKAYSGTISAPSHFLEFQDGSDLGTATSGLDADTMNNIAAADQATDTPTNNFCIANAIAIGSSNLFQFTEGGTVCKRITADQWDFFTTTMPVNKGKWYGEFKIGSGPAMVGIGSLSYFEGIAQSSHTGAGMATNSGVAYYGADGKRWVDNTEAAYGATFGTSDIISIAMDLDNDNVYFAKNGTWQNSGDPTSGATGTGALSTDPVGDYFVMTMNMLYNPTTHFMNYGGYTTISISSAAADANGYGTFEFAPPTGFYALCTKNLAEYG